jgi:anti-sigma B factor antagonist
MYDPRLAANRSLPDCDAHRMSSEGPAPLAPFRVSVSRSDGRVLIAVDGELDLATAPELRDVLVALPEEGAREVTLDLTGLEFIDSTGLSVLVMAFTRERAAGGSLVIRNPSQSVTRILEITGLVSVFTIEHEDAATRLARSDAM